MFKRSVGTVLLLTLAAVSGCASHPPAAGPQGEPAYLESVRRSGFEATRGNVLTPQPDESVASRTGAAKPAGAR